MTTELVTVDYGNERLIIRLEPAGPVDLLELTECLAALSRMFERHRRDTEGDSTGANTKLFVSRLNDGSIVVELVALLEIMGQPISFLAAINTLKEFSTNLIRVLKVLTDDPNLPSASEKFSSINTDVSENIQKFLKPLMGKKSAELQITHAKFLSKDGEKETLIEYKMGASDINLAATKIFRVVQHEERLTIANQSTHRTVEEARMRLFQASAEMGKEKGRTGDKAIIDEITTKPLPLYFPKQSTDYKRKISEETEFPFRKWYIVDVSVEYDADNEPRMYRLLDLHDVLDM